MSSSCKKSIYSPQTSPPTQLPSLVSTSESICTSARRPTTLCAASTTQLSFSSSIATIKDISDIHLPSYSASLALLSRPRQRHLRRHLRIRRQRNRTSHCCPYSNYLISQPSGPQQDLRSRTKRVESAHAPPYPERASAQHHPSIHTHIMTSLVRTDSLNGAGPSTPTMSSKQLPGISQRPGRTGTMRIDLEPIYTALKAAVGENWNLYRESLGLYTMGMLFYFTNGEGWYA